MARYQVGQTLTVVAFGYEHTQTSDACIPFFWGRPEPTKIFFKELTVVEHHKVTDGYSKEATCDGFILKDAEGNVWYNQYPTADYGQITDGGDRRFHYHPKEGENWDTILDNEYNFPTDYTLIGEVVEPLMRGLRKIDEFDESFKRILLAWKERLFKEFDERFPLLKMVDHPYVYLYANGAFGVSSGNKTTVLPKDTPYLANNKTIAEIKQLAEKGKKAGQEIKVIKGKIFGLMTEGVSLREPKIYIVRLADAAERADLDLKVEVTNGLLVVGFGPKEGGWRESVIQEVPSVKCTDAEV